MKKAAVIVLLLLLLFLMGVEGCTPPGFESFKKGGQEVVRLRGLSVEFEKGKPYLSSEEGESLPILRAGKDFFVGLELKNYLLKSINAKVTIEETTEYSNLKKQSKDISVEEAVVQNGISYPGVNSIEFDPFQYDKTKIGKGVDNVHLITEVEIEYEASIDADLCFSREEGQTIGLSCNNDETLTENMLKGDNVGLLPVSIDKIIKRTISIENDEAEFELTIKFRNFNDGKISTIESGKEIEKIEGFRAEIFGSPLSCINSDKIILRNGEASIKCKGTINFSKSYTQQTRVTFTFNYLYKIIKSIKYKVM